MAPVHQLQLEAAGGQVGDRYITAGGVCQMFSISRATLYRWVAKGLLPEAVHFGCSRRWSVRAIQEHLGRAEA